MFVYCHINPLDGTIAQFYKQSKLLALSFTVAPKCVDCSLPVWKHLIVDSQKHYQSN